MRAKHLIHLALLFFCLSAQAFNPPNLPTWPQIGTAKLSVLWFDIYNAELSSENGIYDNAKSFKLTLTYLRDFEANELITETFKQLPKEPTPSQLLSWRKQLEKLWSNVKKGDRISFVKDKKGASHFFFNQDYRGEISDIEFGKNFAAIWLASDSNYPKLAAKLKGT